ncbi:DUF4383 domain-containing protein [Microbacterium sp. YY-01]|uniref:DUF4383 domain-containing protein n=1 Tax=Microbacterium sp. YY-01 TaxID=3421634 RepID=UPI003D178FFB
MSEEFRAAEFATTRLQKISMTIGIVIVLLGVAGFIPGITRGIDQLAVTGNGSEAYIFTVFRVSVVHNVVHIVAGVLGIVCAMRPRSSRQFLLWGAAFFVVLWIFGLYAVGHPEVNFLAINPADNWLHIGLAAVMAASGLIISRDPHGQPRESHTIV